jgi:hypothetical protein
LIIATALATYASLLAQTAPAGSTGKPDYSGTWTLDRGLSADLSKVTFGPAAAGGDRRAGGQGGGGFGRRGGFGGSRQNDRNEASAFTQLEKDRLQALTTPVRTAFDRLEISHHDPNFVVNDARDHTTFFQTTGASDDNHFGDLTIPSTTQWDGQRIVTTYALSSRLKLVCTYTLLPATNQLVLRIALQDSENRRGGGTDVKLAYNRGPSK